MFEPQVNFRGRYGSDALVTATTTSYNKVNSAFHPSGVGKSSTGLYGWD